MESGSNFNNPNAQINVNFTEFHQFQRVNGKKWYLVNTKPEIAMLLESSFNVILLRMQKCLSTPNVY